MLLLLKEKGELLEKGKENDKEKDREEGDTKAKEEKPTGPELTDEEKVSPQNWATRFQWRRKNLAKEGEDYIEIDSPNQEADPNNKSCALVHDEDGKGSPERILVRNQKIQQHLRGAPGLETFEEVRLNLNSIEISSPFSPLFHHIDSVVEAMKKDESATAMDMADSERLLAYFKA